LRDPHRSQVAVPNDTALRPATMFLAELRAGYEPTGLAPSAMGRIGINRRKADRKGFVEFYNKRRVYALFSDRKGEMRVVAVQVDLVSFLPKTHRGDARLTEWLRSRPR